MFIAALSFSFGKKNTFIYMKRKKENTTAGQIRKTMNGAWKKFKNPIKKPKHTFLWNGHRICGWAAFL